MEMETNETLSDPKLSDEQALAHLERVVKLTDLFLEGEKSKEHGWFEELCEALKKSYTTPANLTFAHKDGLRGTHSAVVNSLYQILSLLRDSLLHMRYAESAHILKAIVEGCITSMPLALEIALHRSGLEIMFRHLDLSDPPLNLFFDQLRSINTSINPQQVVIEQFIHSLTSDKFDEAIDVISNLPKISKLMSPTNHAKHIAQLYTAYKGLAYYMQWQKAETEQTSSQIMSHGEQLAENAVQEFESVLDEPGVWDMFIPNHVHLLVILGRQEKAEKTLLSYRARNEDNPYAWKHLIHFYQHSGDNLDYLRTLQDYCEKWPIDKALCLELISHTSAQNEALAARTYFGLLDYSCYKDDVEIWEKFSEFLTKVNDEDVIEDINDLWSERKSWWVLFHFTNRSGDQEPSELFKIKTAVHSVLRDMEVTE